MSAAAAEKLSLHNVSKVYASANRSGIIALSEVDLHVRVGEFLCIVGPSGCGKSTLLSILAGLETPTSGSVLMDGLPIQKAGTERVVIFQEPALFPWLNVLDNVEFGLKMKNIPYPERREKALQALELVHLSQFQDAYVHQLSGGMKQRVALARGLVLDPEILLMDEPFAALDAQTRDSLHEELSRIWAHTKKTIIFVTHNVREAARLGDRILLLSAHPGTVLNEFKVTLPRPRFIEDPGVMDLARNITAQLKSRHREIAPEVVI